MGKWSVLWKNNLHSDTEDLVEGREMEGTPTATGIGQKMGQESEPRQR